jgi:hypothetical protein
MVMAPRVRKLALATHLAFSVGWIGAAVTYLALAIAATAGQDPPLVRGAYLAMELTGWYVIVPAAVGSLLTGIVMSLGTRWGLLRHYWVLFSLVLTLFATVILLLHMRDVSAMADMARQADDDSLDQLGGDLVHPAVGLVVLLVIQALNVFKPRGMTRYGQRKHHQQRVEQKPRERRPQHDAQPPAREQRPVVVQAALPSRPSSTGTL